MKEVINMKKFIFSLFLIFAVLFNAAAYEPGRDWIKASNP